MILSFFFIAYVQLLIYLINRPNVIGIEDDFEKRKKAKKEKRKIKGTLK